MLNLYEQNSNKDGQESKDEEEAQRPFTVYYLLGVFFIVASLFVLGKFVFIDDSVLLSGGTNEETLSGLIKSKGLTNVADKGSRAKKVDVGIFKDRRFVELVNVSTRPIDVEDVETGRDNPFVNYVKPQNLPEGAFDQ